MWFTDTVVDKIGRITPVGQITEFALVGANVHDGIAAGSDGNLWFTAGGDLHSDGSIGKITPSGAISLFPISAPIPRLSRPGAVTAGPDQNLWFTASICTGRHWFGCASSYPIIGKMTPNGAVTEFRIPNEAAEIAAGPDGNLWFVEGNAIGRMTMSGRVISEFLVAVPSDSNLYMLGGITTGPDHNIWVTQTDEGLDESKGPAVFSGKQNVYRITPWGAMTAFSIPPGAEVLVGQMDVTAGSDGKLWFTDSLHNAIGSITTDGVVTEFPIPTPSSQPGGITAGPNGTLWFTETNAGKIGRLTP
ncbi:MAG TPA: hypothetical protein VJP85_07270 [Candidatus Baltobacteraceae bacterium]|nr:hypothetical protein [Candidatus Baltobacteraceae bacterium]